MRTLKTIGILFFSLVAFGQHKIDTGQFAVAQIGKVVFNYFPTAKDTNSIVMRRRTADIINDYVSQNANKKFPLIKLDIMQLDSKKKYGESITIYYVKDEDVFFPLSETFGIVNKSYFVISLSLYDNFEKNGLNAIKYVVNNSSTIKQNSKILKKKIKRGIQTDEDMETLNFAKIN